ncbi:MAG: DUF1080 domain-containing protein [Rhodopirellula sp.]|nr:DUF1080 domain-containing protein [Rhodopirellula sp.]
MRLRVASGAVLTLFLGLAALGQPPQGEKNIARDGSLAEKFDQGRKWAVVIGVNQYLDPLIPSLRFCVADARLVSCTLAERCGYEPDRILLIVDDQQSDHLRPFGINLRKQISGWLKNAEPRDTVLVFFSGHGFLDNQGQAFLAPKDCEKENLGLTGFRVDDLRDSLLQCKASQKLLVLDCCHAGALKAGDSAGPSSGELGAAFRDAAGLVTLASCQKTEQSREWQEKKQGLFTHFLARGLKGEADYDRNAVVDSDELYRFTLDKVRTTAQLEMNAQQTPVRFIPPDVVGVFALARISIASEPPPAPAQPIVAVFTVREEGSEGRPVEDAEVQIWYAAKSDERPGFVASGRSVSDGRVEIPVKLSVAQQSQGAFLVTAKHHGTSNTWSLPDFPRSRSYDLALSRKPAATNSFGLTREEVAQGFVSLFDGKTLNGWQGDERLWRVEEGMIIGSTESIHLSQHSFLSTQRTYQDFILKVRFKLARGNSGIQFRSQQAADGAVTGYQAEIDCGEYRHVAIWLEGQNKILCETDPHERDKRFVLDEWNEYTITCKGPRITLDLNDYRLADYVERSRLYSQNGVIALQLVRTDLEPGMRVYFKDIRIRALN